MKVMKKLVSRRSTKYIAALLFVCGLSVAGITVTSPQAIARLGMKPIEVDPRTNITPGSPLQCGVKLTGASNITIYSSPAGYVSYSGYANATDTVYASTSPNATGTVTVYLTTDGSSSVYALVNCNRTGP